MYARKAQLHTTTNVFGQLACSYDTYPPGVDDCTAWTSYIEGVNMTVRANILYCC